MTTYEVGDDGPPSTNKIFEVVELSDLPPGPPVDWPHIGVCMSNFDHQVDPGFDERLRAGGVFAAHPGWNFHGRVWFAGGLFHEQVWVDKQPRATLTAATLEQLMELVSKQFGND